jgi:HEAT repeat protein
VELTSVEVSTIRERAMAVLDEFTTSERAELRANSIEAMSGVPSRVEGAIEAGLHDESEAVRFTSAMVIGLKQLDEQAEKVRPLLHDSSSSVRAAAIFALTKCGAQVDRSPLASILLGDPSVGARANAAFVLGELGDSSAVPLLREAVRKQVTSSRAPEAKVRLLELQISEAMIKLGDEEQLESVRAALYPSRPEELEATALAVQIIGEVGDQSSVNQLIYLASYREKGQMMPAEVRLAAAMSLAKLGHPGGDPIALEYSGDDREALRAQAAHVLGQSGHEANLAKLDEMMRDESDLVRVSAASGVLTLTGSQMASAGE